MNEPLRETILVDYRTRLATAKDKEFLALHEEFIRWLANLEEFSLEYLEQQDYLAQYQTFFTACQRRYLAIKERQEVNSLLEKSKTANSSISDSKASALRSPSAFPLAQRGVAQGSAERLISEFGKNTYERVQDLCQFVDFSTCRRCVMVGCGALPATLFYIYDRYPTLEYIGIDIDPVAIATAQDAMHLLGIEKIRLVEADGSQFDYAGAGLVYVANQVCPKNRVLERIAATASKKVQVVMRDPTRRGKLLADCGRDVLPRQFSLMQRGKESQHFLSLDLFLRLQPQ